MPCKKGMVGCRRSCAHRMAVHEYRVARHNDMLIEEGVTLGDPEEIAVRREMGNRPITFREWISG